MRRFALNFVYTDDDDQWADMVRSVLPVVDLIVANDASPAGNLTKEMNNFLGDSQVPRYIFTRPFDDFGKSSQFALDKLREVASSLAWDAEETWGLSLKCNEVLMIDGSFSMEDVYRDLYFIEAKMNGKKVHYRFLFRLARNFEWRGPVHETLTWEGLDIVKRNINGIHIEQKEITDQEKQLEKLKKEANLLTRFLEEGNNELRWYSLTAQTFFSIGKRLDQGAEQQYYFKQSLFFYEQLAKLFPDKQKDVFLAFVRIGMLRESLGFPDLETIEAYENAYSICPGRGEPIKLMILYFMRKENWSQALAYSQFAFDTYFEKDPVPENETGDHSFYTWEILQYHYVICRYLREHEKAKDALFKLTALTYLHPEYFTEEQIIVINGYNAARIR